MSEVSEGSDGCRCYASIDECIQARPASLTAERAESFLPSLETCPEWRRKRDAGELPEGIKRIFGSMITKWPDVSPTREEAEWILSLQEFGSWRWLAGIVTHGDTNQITGMHLIEASERVLSEAKSDG